MGKFKLSVVVIVVTTCSFFLCGFQKVVIAPVAPATLIVTPISESQIHLTWTDKSNDETSFRIERSKDGKKFTKIAQVKEDSVSYTSSGLSAATKYYYRVCAVNSKSKSGYSDTVAAFTHTGEKKSDWSEFVYPTVDFTDEATDLEGSAIFHTAIPNVTEMMKEQCLAVCKELYTDNKDRRSNFTTLHLRLKNNPNGIAITTGTDTEKTIAVSAQFVAFFYHQNGNNYDLVMKEIRGILAHEGTHGYQYFPKNCGEYDGKSTYWGLVEGVADGVRAVINNWTPTRYPSKGRNWNTGYETGGFFLSWCKQTKKPTFLIELNHAARDMETFSWEAAFLQILGQPVQTVWDEYQKTIPGNPILPTTLSANENKMDSGTVYGFKISPTNSDVNSGSININGELPTIQPVFSTETNSFRDTTVYKTICKIQNLNIKSLYNFAYKLPYSQILYPASISWIDSHDKNYSFDVEYSFYSFQGGIIDDKFQKQLDMALNLKSCLVEIDTTVLVLKQIIPSDSTFKISTSESAKTAEELTSQFEGMSQMLVFCNVADTTTKYDMQSFSIPVSDGDTRFERISELKKLGIIMEKGRRKIKFLKIEPVQL